MREILFRGKRVFNGEWVHGYYVRQQNCHEIEVKNYVTGECFDRYSVVPETIGQFTGLYDKNGKRIFEWDIVKYKTAYRFTGNEDLEEFGNENPDRIDECIEVVKWSEKGCCFTPAPKRVDCEDYWYSYGTYDFEIIGNIHDNPEFLEVKIECSSVN